MFGVLGAGAATDLATASTLLLHPHSQNATSQVAGLVEWIERWAKPDMESLPAAAEQALKTLASNRDIDVRALGLAALHFTRGQNGATRKMLRQQLSGERADSAAYYAALRRRWMTVLGSVGDAASETADFTRAMAAYRKALEVVPNDPTILVNEGLAYTAQQNPTAAMASFRAALRVNPAQPMAEVNLGIALEQIGDASGAVAAYERSIAVDPTAPLGYLNLGTFYLRQENAVRAIPYFEKALGRDPGLAVGHFQLALAQLRVENLATSGVIRKTVIGD